MNLINNILLHTGDSKEIALAAHDRSLELDPTVAYIVTMTALKPLLEKGYAPNTDIESSRSSRSASKASSMSPTFRAASDKINKILEGHFENIKDKLGDIRKIIDELKAKAEFFMGLLSKGENKHHIVGKEWEEFENKFVYATKRIMDTVKLIRESIKKLRSLLSKNAKYPALDEIEKYCQNLIDKIPDPSSKWDVGDAKYDGFKWMHKSINGEEKKFFSSGKRGLKALKIQLDY